MLLAGACNDSQPEAEPEKASWEALRSLPYVDARPVEDSEETSSGVFHHDETRANPGLTLFTPRPEARALLVELDGTVIHEWHAPRSHEEAWQHVALTWSVTDSRIRLYHNGSEVAYAQQQFGSGSVRPDTSHPYIIGIRGGLGAVHAFNGRIDEVRLYSRVLSADEIRALAE